MRLFLDANVIFAAAISPDGRCRALFELASAGYCALLTSPHALEETRRNITAKYPEALTRLERDLIPKLIIVGEAPVSRVNWAMEMGLPLKDAPILATAVENRADLLVTGDKKHFGSFYGQILEEVTVVDPAEAIALLLNQEKL
ncbi:MAG: putative toxin-antitoxin system toxin component, PIN family [Moorea sp. SIO1F2]|uniref:putative toxin-antitoxin system toxin component, PIN family n=1 Tax=unclassified Moorena TaxID=2683338 RepID=UPI0013BA0A3B|nr:MULTISPECIES: putative toxin-antitoxin system toxin component, PIN family [unclassified Moorena]NEO17909.1 putative toxin-antitoxin system toxin component, PIN family [Moorena sp. SIO4A5]NEQ59843.1 putative toxin-antitoxin system toxin component, PIN family [Moorena sp. SIO4A1]NET81380.1 putative toxin-antitoxin system toxin component, PIN family [Moorena sp. SIO1F2]